ncbi:MAG: hypothetical protein EOO39_33705 [Cytophagaceae bacterium]|nr:MAG: hypothetical protein EOO39_33705 [Cytophagaceae bacterium]
MFSRRSITLASLSTCLIAIVVGIDCFGGRAAQAQYLYGITNNGSLYEVNPTIQYTTSVFTQSLSMTSANGLAYDDANGRLFYFGAVGGSSNFYTWDRTTGQQAQITGTRPTASIACGSFYNNAFWYINGSTDTLVRLNLDFSTPTAPVVSSFQQFTNFDGTALGNFTFGDISIRSDGVLFGSSNNGIFSVDVSSGVPTNFARISTNSTLYQIGFGADGTLYGETSANGNWYTLNTGTGAATSMGYTSTDSTGATVAFNDISEGAVRGIAVVPELNTAALLGLALPLVAVCNRIGAVAVVRRRKK